MTKKIDVKLILELRASGMSRNEIAASRHMGKHSVSDVIHIAEEQGITFEQIKDKPDNDVYQMFFPEKHCIESLYDKPDYEYVHTELKKTGVTLKLLWEEYKDICCKTGKIPVGYTKYCDGYSNYTVANKLTNHLAHKPGMVVEVDWSGSTMSYVDITTGELISVYLFVATLPYSQYSYVEPCLDMKKDNWLRCHIHMYEYFGGVPTRTVCDNLKTGVLSHPRHGDIILNEDYEALGSHYMTAIMPTGVKKPRQKASVEGTVGKIATAIIASLRTKIFTSLAELKIAVKGKLEEFNRKDFQKRDYSRYEVFQEEKQYLRPLPALPYEIANWVYDRKIGINFHVNYAKNFYSCPYQYAGKSVDLKITDTTLEIFCNNERIATHNKFPEYVMNKYSTHPEDMPESFRKTAWDDERILNWASHIGNHTLEVIKRIFNSVKIKEQGYNPSLSVLRLSKDYSEARLETACEIALTYAKVPRYHHLKAILAANQDQIFLEQKRQKKQIQEDKDQSGYVRGAAYYGGKNND